MLAKIRTSQLAVSPSLVSELEAVHNSDKCDMSPRSPLDIDRMSDHTKNSMSQSVLPKAPIKKVSFSTCETMSSRTDTQHTERTALTIKEEQNDYFDCVQNVDEDRDYDDLDYHDDDDQNDIQNDDLIATTSPVSIAEAKTVTASSTKRRRKVRWSGQVRVQEIRHINNMPESEISAVWMSPIDYKMIKNMAKTTVLMMMTGEKITEDDPDFCSRGLEFRTRKGNKFRSANKLRGRSAVLNEQDLQREEGFHDPEFIAMASLDVSFDCREQAQRRGERDAQSIQDYVSDVAQEVRVILF